MIISRTPFRVSFCGGGTDQKEYWEDHGGAVLSTAISKYLYIIVKNRFDNELWLKYSENEIARNVDDVKHTRWQACMRMTGATKGIEIVNLSDIPKESGLGGSSAFTVGSLNSLHAMMGKHKSSKELAREACEIEISELKEPIGLQDQYAVSYGGFNLIEFGKDGNVEVSPLIISLRLKRELFSNLMMFRTGNTREAKSVLAEQKAVTKSKVDVLHKMKEFAYESRDALYSSDLRKFGELLHKNWECKKQMAGNISNYWIDDYYEKAKMSGAVGGKICGAGAGGFFVFYVEPENQDKVRLALKDLQEFKVGLDNSGSKIIYVGDAE